MRRVLLLGGLVLTVAVSAAAVRTDAAERKPRLVRVVSGLDEPVYAVGAPGGAPERTYVVERKGRIRVVNSGRILSTPFADLRGVVNAVGYRGLLSMVFHPRFPADPRFFVHYVGRDNDAYVDELRVRNGRAVPASRRTVLRVDVHPGGSNHYGGQVAFGGDGRLYASFGEATDGPAAQRSDTLLGKLVRIAVDRPHARPEIVAYGLRNPWRFSFDTATGDMYIGDVGESLREEVNRLPRSFRGIPNFGWNIFEGGIRHRPVPTDLVGTLLPPFVEYPTRKGRCDSVVGGYVYRGRRVPALRGRYVYGDLCGGAWSVRVAGGRASGHRTEPLSPGAEPLVSFGRTASGELLVVGFGGSLYRIE